MACMDKAEIAAGRFRRLTNEPRKTVHFQLDGKPAVALEGDTVLTAVLVNTDYVRRSEFGDGLRSGFCLMGACQDCWVWLQGGHRLRACTSKISDGMRVLTEPDKESWPTLA